MLLVFQNKHDAGKRRNKDTVLGTKNDNKNHHVPHFTIPGLPFLSWLLCLLHATRLSDTLPPDRRKYEQQVLYLEYRSVITRFAARAHWSENATRAYATYKLTCYLDILKWFAFKLKTLVLMVSTISPTSTSGPKLSNSKIVQQLIHTFQILKLIKIHFNFTRYSPRIPMPKNFFKSPREFNRFWIKFRKNVARHDFSPKI